MRRADWQNKQSHVKFLNGLGVQLGYKCMDDWYNVTQKDIHKNGGHGLLHNYYNDSPSFALQSIYPEHNWELGKFKNKPMRLCKSKIQMLFSKNTPIKWETMFWKKKENHRKFFDWLMVQLGYKSMDEWYNVTQADIHNNGGHGLLKSYYNGSPSSALQSVYSEHDWMLWKFKVLPHGYWNKVNNKEISRMINWLSGQLSIQDLTDWYRVSLVQINKLLGIASAKELCQKLHEAYPQHQWDNNQLTKLGCHIKASQRDVLLAVQHLFPSHSMCTIMMGKTLQRLKKSTSTQS